MRFKTIAVLTALFAALLGYLYFFEMGRTEAQRQAQEQARKALHLDQTKVSRLTLWLDDLTVVGQKVGQEWQLLQPVQAPGNWKTFEELLTAASGIRVAVVADSTVAASGEAPLSDFGLDRPEVKVAIAQADAPPDTFAFGDRNPMGNFVYVKKSGRPEVLWTSAWQKKQFQRSLLDFRDRRMLPFDMDWVRKLKVAYDGQVIVASRQGVSWRLEQPVAEKGDDAAIAAFLNHIQTGTAERFVAEQAGDLAAYGLDRPWMNLSVYEGEDLAEKTVILGGGTEPVRFRYEFFAKFLSRPAVFTVDSLFVLGLKKTVGDFRNKMVFGFDHGGVDRMEAVYPDLRTVCAKQSGGWAVLHPEGHTVVASQVEALIRRVSDLKANRFVADRVDDPARYGLDHPAVHLKLMKGSRVLREIALGSMNEQVYAKADHRPDVVEVNPEILDELRLRLYLAEPK